MRNSLPTSFSGSIFIFFFPNPAKTLNLLLGKLINICKKKRKKKGPFPLIFFLQGRISSFESNSFMGICLSAGITDESPCNTGGLNSKPENGADKNESCNSSSKEVPLTTTPRSEDEILNSSNVKSFTLSELKTATWNFHPNSVLGEGGFWLVFKGWIDEHSLAPAKPDTRFVIAVKKLNQGGLQGHKEWLAEVDFLGHLSHPNLVKLIGYYLEDEHRLLVYEFMPRGCLENHLFRNGTYFHPLSWSLRLKVALDAAKGLAYLHSDRIKVIYRDFKTSNIPFDSNYTAKLSDFELAKDGPRGEKSHLSTEVMGTHGYLAPEYMALGRLTAKSDVYSFGVVLLELLSGRRAIEKTKASGEQNLVGWAKSYLANKRKIFKILDNRLEGQYILDEAFKIGMIALRCLLTDAKFRPTMEEIVSELKQLVNLKETSSILHNSSEKARRRSADDVSKKLHVPGYPRVLSSSASA